MNVIKGAKILLESLYERGLDTVFGIPGGANLAIYDELFSSNFSNILARQEASAVHMADGYARVARRPAVCLVTSGPGATNMVTGMATAYVDSSPVIGITGQVSTGAMGKDSFQESDAFDLMIPVTKFNFKVKSPEEIPVTVDKAYKVSMTGRFGPVSIDVPADVATKDATSRVTGRIPELLYETNFEALSQALHALDSSQKPLILVGGGAKWDDCGQEIMKFAEKIGSPVITTVMGKGAVPEDHPLSMGTTGMFGRWSSQQLMKETDLVIALGTRFSDRTTGKTSDFLTSAKVIHADIDGREIGKNVDGVIGLTGSCGEIVGILNSHVHDYAEKRIQWTVRAASMKSFCKCDINYGDQPLKPQKLIYEMSRLLPDDVILTADVGQHQMFATHYFEAKGRRDFITSGGLGTMGFGLPAAIGAKIAAPDRKVVSLVGDGGFQMTFSEFSTAVENNVPVFIIVMNNGSLGMVRQFQKQFYNHHIFSTDYEKGPNFAKFAEAMGGNGVVVEKASEVADAIKAGLKSDIPFVADVRVDVMEDCLPMIPAGASRSSVVFGRCKWGKISNGEIANFGR